MDRRNILRAQKEIERVKQDMAAHGIPLAVGPAHLPAPAVISPQKISKKTSHRAKILITLFVVAICVWIALAIATARYMDSQQPVVLIELPAE